MSDHFPSPSFRERLLEALFASATDYAIIAMDLAGRVISWNEGAQRLLGWAEADMLGRPAEVFFNEGDRRAGAPAQEMRRALADGRSADERWHIRRDGTRFWGSGEVMPLRTPDGGVEGFIKILRDRTEKREAEERQRLLMEELAHRMKNTLTVVQAIVSQTLRGSGVSAEARDALSTRLLALSRAHDLLMHGRWTEASLLALVEGTAQLHAHGAGDRFCIDGPDVMLGSRSAMSLALVLHELATNAVKYGALSVAEGQVRVLWEICEDEAEKRFRLRWQEVGGPPVRPPERQGFGTRLIERSFRPGLGTTLRLDYPETGVTFVLEAPLPALEQ